MSSSRSVAILTGVVATLILVVYIADRTASKPPAISASLPPKVDQKMRADFKALQKKLPALVAEWSKKNLEELVEVKKLKTEVKLARFTGPSEAKVTLLITMDIAELLGFGGPLCVSFYLRYFDGRWTTIRADTSAKPEAFTPLMLAIDQASEK